MPVHTIFKREKAIHLLETELSKWVELKKVNKSGSRYYRTRKGFNKGRVPIRRLSIRFSDHVSPLKISKNININPNLKKEIYLTELYLLKKQIQEHFSNEGKRNTNKDL